MFDEHLNVVVVRQRARERGHSLSWLSKEVGMKKHPGYVMLREGLLPKDPAKREQVLQRLSKVLGLERSRLVLPPVRAPKMSA